MLKANRQLPVKKDNSLKIIFLSFFLLIVCFCLVVLNVQISRKRKALTEEVNFLEKRFSELSANRDSLSQQTANVNNNFNLEIIAKEGFNLKKDGEAVVAFPQGIESISNSAATIEEKEAILKEVLEKNQID